MKHGSCHEFRRSRHDRGLVNMTNEAQPSDQLNPNPNSYAWHPQGWEMAGEGTVSTAAHTSRGQAAAFFVDNTGVDFADVRVWKRYVRSLTRQEVWDDYGRERWEEQHDLDLDEGPSVPPSEWMPDDYDPTWEFVHRSHPAAIPVWVCGVKGDKPPANPRALPS